jgi:excisionase family DNA binding protein
MRSQRLVTSTSRRADGDSSITSVRDEANNPRHPNATVLAPLLTLDEVASFLRLNPRTIRRLVASGRLPCARLVGRLRFLEADVVRFVQARKG